MAFTVDRPAYRFANDVDMFSVLDRLAELGELSAEGTLGVRFEPVRSGWPPTYFRADGTIQVVSGRLGLSEVATYLDELSEVLGSDIVELGPEH